MYLHILLCIVWCDVLLFLLGSVKFCKLLCNSTFSALMYVIIQDWVTFGNFVFCFVSQYYDMFQLVKLYYAYVISCMALSGQKLDGQAGGMGIVLNDAAIFCHPLFKRRTNYVDSRVAVRNHLWNVLLNILRQSQEMVTQTPWITCNTD